MKKMVLFLLMFFLVISPVFALDLNIEKQSANEVMILGLNQPATFDLKVTNFGGPASLVFYTFFSQDTYPKGTVNLVGGQVENVPFLIYPPAKIKTGYYNFDSFIRDKDGSEITLPLTVNVIQFQDAFEIGSAEFDPTSATLNLYVHNKVSFDFKNVTIAFTSPFFDIEKQFSLGPNQRNDFIITLDKEDFKKLIAGYYTFNANIEVNGVKTNLEGTLKFSEKDILTTSKKTYGVIINTNVIQKTNEGNTVANTETVVKKNIISRLFTHFSPEPNLIERQGFSVYYTWDNELAPGEILNITVRTNWVLPFLIIILIVLVVIVVKKTSNRNIILKKKVSFVNAKGGEFALKVMILVEAKNFIEKISVIDRLPFLTKIHEKFGGEKPSRVDEKNKKIEWNFERMQPGERRVFSYIIYSRIGVLGKFALPVATAVYEKEGKVKERKSNQAFFMLEPRTRKDLEE
jgi:hypothetical protein